jgi:hypothetical protein
MCQPTYRNGKKNTNDGRRIYEEISTYSVIANNRELQTERILANVKEQNGGSLWTCYSVQTQSISKYRLVKVKHTYTGIDRPLGLQEVEAPRISK